MKIKLLFSALLSLALLSTGYAQTPEIAKLNQFFDRLAEKNKAMGSLVIAKDGKVVYSRTIGYSQVSGTEKTPMTVANRFRIASVTKMLTATMILQLAEEGKLKLDDKLDKFFPQIPNAGKITILQLLGHRSGVPNVRRVPNAIGTVPQVNVNTLPITKDEMLALVAKVTPDFEPDTKHLYSNSGYYLLGLILEKATSKPYEEALRERISSKIGLKDTYTATGNIDVSKNESLTYMNLAGDWKQVPETHPSILFGAGAIVSTPDDMVKFIQALFNLKLVSKQSLDLMKTIREGDGLGMEPFTFAGKTFYGHTGGGDNYGAWLAYLPEEKLAVAYTTNAKVYPVADIMTGAMDIFYNKPFQIPAFESIAVSTEVLDRYVGVYAVAGTPAKFTITRNGATLYAAPPGQSAVPLEATAQNTFKIDNGTREGIVLEFDNANKQMTLKRTGMERIFTKEN